MDKVGDSKRVQLEILQTRIGVHGLRMWQLPLSYLGLVAISLNALTTEQKVFPDFIVLAALSILGIIMTWALYGAHRRYQQTVDNANELEAELQIKKYAHCDAYHTYPYYGLMIFGIVCCLLASIALYCQ
jgi:hypothetical protein